ncbi:uncharacterized protein [Drosophila takahashii]|uniref:uncharacterized protein n=1 Tax=Drosophila takahashii TaxID=29030 RepID=UPI0038994AE3
MDEFKQQFFSTEVIDDLHSFSAVKGFDFNFIPPRAPHFGGLWEAAVKSAKTLLLKNISEANLTYEELETTFAEIEAILNSRPIAPQSDDPNDGIALTPAHFLVGSSLLAAPDERIFKPQSTTQLSYLDRWQRVTFLKQQFWSMWQRDYIHTLQRRGKWNTQQANIKPGQLVIIHEDNTPPQHWILARVVSAIPGKDGKVRVVDLQTSKNVLRRPIHKIAPLPME